MGDFVTALVCHSTLDVHLFVPPGAHALAESRIERSATTSVRDRRELADGGAFSAWHELAFDAFAPFELRRRLGGVPWPVTIAHHSLSYPALLGNVLTLLLQPSRPFDAVVCSSTAARQALVRLTGQVSEGFASAHGTRAAFGGRFEVIPFGVDTERFAPGDRYAGRTFLALPPESFVLLWVGRLSAVDKADLLPMVAAFADVSRRYPSRDLRLVCIGTEHRGEGAAGALRAYAARVGVADAVSVRTDLDDELPLAYAAADVFVAPVDNVQESFGLAPVEAMACGVPQIVSDWNGYRDTVVHDETGFLVPTVWAPCCADLDGWAFLSDAAHDHVTLAQSVAVDMEAWKRAVATLVEREDLRREMARRSRTRALERFTLASMVARHEELWAELGAIAHAAPPAPADARPSYAMPRYYSAFGHFASRVLKPQDRLRLAPLGEAFAAGETTAPAYHARWGHLRSDVLSAIVSAVAEIDEARPALAGEVVAAAREACAVPRDLVVRQLLWLLKYDLVRLVD
jgi:glycosyltransferase involved in cell wall biosynthesis